LEERQYRRESTGANINAEVSQRKDAEDFSIHNRPGFATRACGRCALKACAMPHPTLIIILTLLILLIALPLVSLWTGKRIRAAATTRAAKFLRYARTIVILWSLTALALYALRLHNIDPTYVGLQPPHFAWQFAFGLIPLVAPLATTLVRGQRVLNDDYARALRAIVPADLSQWILFVPLAASAGICEEFLYRGFALRELSAMSGNVAYGALLSSVAFGIGHAYQGRPGVIGATMTGLLYAVVYLATGSLYPCMLGHFMQDIAGAAVLSRKLQEIATPAASADTPAAAGQ
jgi:membrane protease YdiL (CAAX protease family)